MRSAASTWRRISSTSGDSAAAQAPTQSAKVETSRSMPSRAKPWLCRLSGKWSPYLPNRTIASNPAPARPRAIGWKGAGGWVIRSHARQLNFSRTVWITFHCRGITSSVSVTSSPSLTSLPWQHGQTEGATMTTRSRGRCAGSGARTGLRREKLLTTLSPPLAAAASVAQSSSVARRLQLFELQLQLVEQPALRLRRRTKPLALQFGDQELQMRDHRLGAGSPRLGLEPGRTLGEERRLQRIEIVGHGVGRRGHAADGITKSAA